MICLLDSTRVRLTKLETHVKPKINDLLFKFRVIGVPHILIAGGSISSLILGERVNDYDVYFPLAENLTLDRIFPPELVEQFELEIISTKFGETIVTNNVQHSKSGIMAAPNKYLPKITIIPAGEEYWPSDLTKVFISQSAITFVFDNFPAIQFIPKYFDMDVRALLQTFDFLHVQAGYAYGGSDEDFMVLPNDVLEAITTKTVIYTGSQQPIGSMLRLAKLVRNEWNASNKTILAIAQDVAALDMYTAEEAIAQLGGVFYTEESLGNFKIYE